MSAEFADEPLLLLHRGFSSRGWFDAACHNADVIPRLVLESGAPLSQPIDNTADNLREAVWRFVTRHQHEKLEKHVRRGNLNGFPNFLDIRPLAQKNSFFAAPKKKVRPQGRTLS
jgi:hypothetical protein